QKLEALLQVRKNSTSKRSLKNSRNLNDWPVLSRQRSDVKLKLKENVPKRQPVVQRRKRRPERKLPAKHQSLRNWRNRLLQQEQSLGFYQPHRKRQNFRMSLWVIVENCLGQ